MRSLILLAFLALPVQAQEAVWTNGRVTVRLMQGPCKVEPLAEALKGEADKGSVPKEASVQIGDMEVPACWAMWEDKVLIGDVLGNAGNLPYSAFKPAGI